jgi:hypothetical protein
MPLFALITPDGVLVQLLLPVRAALDTLRQHPGNVLVKTGYRAEIT